MATAHVLTYDVEETIDALLAADLPNVRVINIGTTHDDLTEVLLVGTVECIRRVATVLDLDDADVDLDDDIFAVTRPRRSVAVDLCSCACATGGFCGGCGHAGCARRG
jgi:hypothetical protein